VANGTGPAPTVTYGPLVVTNYTYTTNYVYTANLASTVAAAALGAISNGTPLGVVGGSARIILPDSTNGLSPGMLWNNAGTVSVKQ